MDGVDTFRNYDKKNRCYHSGLKMSTSTTGSVRKRRLDDSQSISTAKTNCRGLGSNDHADDDEVSAFLVVITVVDFC